MKFLVDRLWLARDTPPQLVLALEDVAPEAAVSIAERLRTSNETSGSLLETVCVVFSRSEGRAASAAQPLASLAADPGASGHQRRAALRLLECLGVSAREATATLTELAQREPALAGAANEALYEFGAIERTLAALRERPTTELLASVASWGNAWRDAGPGVVPLLKHADWDVRRAAAETLGYIGYEEGAPALIEALSDAEDWSLVYAAAEALGRMKVASAVPALQRVATGHWFPPVREAARRALEVIAGRGATIPVGLTVAMRRDFSTSNPSVFRRAALCRSCFVAPARSAARCCRSRRIRSTWANSASDRAPTSGSTRSAGASSARAGASGVAR